MTFAEAVAARRSIRSFEDRPVPRDSVRRAIALAVQAPAPHHSAPWRFSLVEERADKDAFSRAMGAAWRDDLTSDGLPPEKVDSILSRSHGLLTSTPLLTVCSADMSRAHSYPDERRRLAEWSLFAHATGAALQVYMVALAEEGIASCWISAPVFCRDVVRAHLALPEAVEPQALVLVGYPAADYVPRERPPADADDYIVTS
ncbi:MAG TPA: nitroreductase family protein [Actinomycetota bacterium]|nr:nitroreductase family protein [Actinomycetota bacterium]